MHSFGPGFGSASGPRGLLEPGTLLHPRPGGAAAAGRFTPRPDTWPLRGAGAAKPHVVSNATCTADAHEHQEIIRRRCGMGIGRGGLICAARNSPVVANWASRAEPGRHIPEQSDPRHTMQIVHYPNPQRSCLGCPLILSLPGNLAGDCDFGRRPMHVGLPHRGSSRGRSCRTDTVVS